MAARDGIIVASLAAHVLLGFALGKVPRARKEEATAIALAEPKKKEKPKPPPPEPPKPIEPKAPPAPRPAAPKAAPAPAPEPAAPAAPRTSSYRNLGAIPAGGSSGGNGAPARAAGGPPPPKEAPPKLKSLAPVPALADSCPEEASKPKRLKAVTPVYSAGAREAQIEGTVRFEADIDEEGRVVAVRIVEGLGNGLDEATIEAVKAWSFEPALRCGRPTKTTIKTKVSFSLT